MTFDLFTLAAQIVNFVILLVLLRVFLYGPVRRAMHERERRIAEKHREANEAQAEALREKERLAEAHEAWERERRSRERGLDEELSERRERRLEDIEEEAASARGAMADALERDRDEALRRLRRRSLELLVSELQRALHDLADASLERQALTAFHDRLERLDEAQRAELRDAATDGSVVIATTFEPDDDALASIVASLRELLGGEVDVSVERDDDLGFGVVLQLGGVRVAWTADAYAEAYAERQEAVLDDAARDLRGASSRDREADADDG